MTAGTENDTRDRGLPQSVPPPERSYSLYENVEYQQHWEDETHRRQDALERHILSAMLPSVGRRIIDLGGGYGRLVPLYLERFDQAILYDGSMSLLRSARETLGDGVVLVAGDVGALPFRERSFDCILSIRVLQHVHDLPASLAEMRRVIAGHGHLVFSYHNKRNANRILRYPLTRKEGSPFSLDSAELGPALISHHPAAVESDLLAAGFGKPEYKGTVVIDSLARVTERMGATTPAGSGWSGFMGTFKLAPWLIGSCVAAGEDALQAGDSIWDMFVCPVCHDDVEPQDAGGSLECVGCGRHYPVEDGIADFRVQGVGS